MNTCVAEVFGNGLTCSSNDEIALPQIAFTALDNAKACLFYRRHELLVRVDPERSVQLAPSDATVDRREWSTFDQ